jgi:hypothetical protein
MFNLWWIFYSKRTLYDSLRKKRERFEYHGRYDPTFGNCPFCHHSQQIGTWLVGHSRKGLQYGYSALLSSLFCSFYPAFEKCGTSSWILLSLLSEKKVSSLFLYIKTKTKTKTKKPSDSITNDDIHSGEGPTPSSLIWKWASFLSPQLTASAGSLLSSPGFCAPPCSLLHL